MSKSPNNRGASFWSIFSISIARCLISQSAKIAPLISMKCLKDLTLAVTKIFVSVAFGRTDLAACLIAFLRSVFISNISVGKVFSRASTSSL